LRVTPEAFQIVVRAGLLKEDVYDEVAVVQQDPLGIFVAFQADWQLTLLFDLEMNFVGDCLILTGIGSGTDDEVVCETGNLPEVQNNDVERLF
jgi:hypothetical protein